MKSIKDEILLVIPYINAGQGNELELSLTGWRKFCKSPLRIIVIGDYNECIEGKAEHIAFERIKDAPGQYIPNIDVARKLDYIYEKFHNEYDHFVLANDDEYPIKDFDWKFLTNVYFLQPSFIGNSVAPVNYWIHDMSKTRVALDKEKKGHINFCNHHPFYFDMEKFHDMSVKFDLANNSLIRENLYYNYYEIKHICNVNEVRYGQWDQKMDGLNNALKNTKIKFVCNSTTGWSKTLEDTIRKHYISKSVEVIKENKLEVSDEIIVSFTSWKKRINLCAKMVDRMMNQTIKPNKIILNLSTDEFPNKEEELPKELVEKQNDVFEIYWVKENTKVYKKIIPTLERFPNGIIISIDDDIEYPNNAIEILYKKYKETNRLNPISAGTWDWEGGVVSHLGCLTLFTKDMFGPYLKDLYENVVLKEGIDTIPFDDAIFTYSILLNKRKYIRVNEITSVQLVKRSPEHNNNRLLHQLKDTYSISLNREHKILREYIKNTYNKTYDDLIHPKEVEKYYSIGKKYNDEKAIISLTSWRARINTVYKTIDSLLYNCPGFHIVLVLSEEEFPKKENELPKSLMKYVNENKIEILWVYKNYKAFKKVLFTMDKYKDVPIISADDDCIYLRNYAKDLYDEWLRHKTCFISIYGEKRKDGVTHTGGAATLYPPYIFKENGINCLTDEIIQYTNQDDDYYTCLKGKMKLFDVRIIKIRWRDVYKFHNEIEPLNKEIRKKSKSERERIFEFINKNIVIS